MYHPPLLPILHPLLSIGACSAITGKGGDDLLAGIEEGSLIGFNIAVSEKSARRCVRILTKSLAAYLAGQPKPVLDGPAKVRAEVDAIVPALAVTLRSETVERIFSCENEHVQNLRRRQLLETARPGRRGAGGSTLFVRRSAVEFLVRRWLR